MPKNLVTLPLLTITDPRKNKKLMLFDPKIIFKIQNSICQLEDFSTSFYFSLQAQKLFNDYAVEFFFLFSQD